MSPSTKKYKKEYAFSLLRIAKGDLASAKVLARSKEGRAENSIYLAQQSIEKALKAVLCFKTQQILHTHDVEVLVQILPVDEMPPEAHRLGALTQYATIRRYEEGYEELFPSDLDLVMDLGDRILKWANDIINKSMSSKHD
ncbi:MAG TPA: HEPN domain-containing protein [Pseudobdellovibrionaceae bacterium]|nr:HEPN domain-containing protein [Pseudobdellovibrionaceae bacterium]